MVIALDPDVGVSPKALASAWDAYEETRSLGEASVVTSAQRDFLPDVITLVAIPIAVNPASTALTAMVHRLVVRLAPLCDYAPLERARREQRLLFPPGTLEPFEGRRGFLTPSPPIQTRPATPVKAAELMRTTDWIRRCGSMRRACR